MKSYQVTVYFHAEAYSEKEAWKKVSLALSDVGVGDDLEVESIEEPQEYCPDGDGLVREGCPER